MTHLQKLIRQPASLWIAIAGASLLIAVIYYLERQHYREQYLEAFAIKEALSEGHVVDLSHIKIDDWDHICLTGAYKQPTLEVKRLVNEEITMCHVPTHENWLTRKPAISYVKGKVCLTFYVPTDIFDHIERDSGARCYSANAGFRFSLKDAKSDTLIAHDTSLAETVNWTPQPDDTDGLQRISEQLIRSPASALRLHWDKRLYDKVCITENSLPRRRSISFFAHGRIDLQNLKPSTSPMDDGCHTNVSSIRLQKRCGHNAGGKVMRCFVTLYLG